MQSSVVLAVLVASAAVLVSGRPSNPGYAQPDYNTPPAYAYQYGVADDYSGANFNQEEQRDGYATRGSYRVLLPDGRTQIVNYSVGDEYTGYVADVQYEGTPTYGPGPAYKAAPAPAYVARRRR